MVVTAQPLQVCEPLFSANRYPTTKITIDQGGTSSAKTYTILQVLALIACYEKYQVITVVGQDMPNLRKGSMRDFENIIRSSGFIQSQIKEHNKSSHTYTFYSGTIIEFTSYKDEQDAKSGKRDYLFCNECNGIKYMVYWQLAFRTRKHIWLDYNPTAKFWVHENLIGEANVTLIISDHQHNQFLSDEQHEEIEGIADKELWKVYARGRTGKIEGLIYPNYQVIEEIPEHLQTVCGLDFGYNHKMALTEVTADGKKLYWNELIYQSELTSNDLIVLMKTLHLGRKPIYCDHARPDSIEDLKRAGFNALPADKDVFNGIQFVKSHNLYLTKQSVGLRKEVGHYMWEKDKNGNGTDKPIKFMDDGCFVGETPIKTISGVKPIQSLTTEDYVLTSNGYKQVLNKFNNGWKEICEYKIVTLLGEIQITCTPNHLLKTSLGWIPISELQKGATLFLASNLTGKLTESTKEENIIPGITDPYMPMYGNISMVKYQKAMNYTIRTKTQKTTIPATCNYLLYTNTKATMQSNVFKKIQHGSSNSSNLALKRQKHGTAAMKAGSGIAKMLKRIPPLYMKRQLKRNVLNAAILSTPLLLIKKAMSFAAINARAGIGVSQALIMSKGFAKNALRLSPAISIAAQNFAVPVVVKSIHGNKKGVQQVYDIEVKDVHEYFANGILVHNCDSGRYGTYTHYHGGTVAPVISNLHTPEGITRPTKNDLLRNSR